jgi:hypothetical protein
MSDSINNNRTTEIRLSDDSTIDLNLSIYLTTDSSGSIANERLNSTQLSKTLALVEYMLITACQCSVEEMEGLLKQHATRN